MRATLLQRALLAFLPASVILSVAFSAIWGDNGLLTRHRLERELRRANAELAALDRENQRLIRDLQLMDEDPIVLERMVAEELGWGRSDAVIVRFPEDHGAANARWIATPVAPPADAPADGAE